MSRIFWVTCDRSTKNDSMNAVDMRIMYIVDDRLFSKFLVANIRKRYVRYIVIGSVDDETERRGSSAYIFWVRRASGEDTGRCSRWWPNALRPVWGENPRYDSNRWRIFKDWTQASAFPRNSFLQTGVTAPYRTFYHSLWAGLEQYPSFSLRHETNIQQTIVVCFYIPSFFISSFRTFDSDARHR